MTKNITIIDGHPDADESHLIHGLANAYEKGALSAGHSVKRLNLATLDFEWLRSVRDYESGIPPQSIAQAQAAIKWADHLVILYPLWLGTMPALLKAFLEQCFRPGFAIESEGKSWPKKLLKKHSARIVITMGMPAFVYRLYFQAHSLKSFERNILKFCGISPISATLFGMIGNASPKKYERYLNRMTKLGRNGR